MGLVLLLRHGETEWSAAHRHTGRTDLPLTTRGEAQAATAASLLAPYDVVRARTSPLRRATDTARIVLHAAGLGDVPLDTDPDLQEWDYGAYEGLTTPQIRAQRPGWLVFRDGCPGGEMAYDVGRRADRVIAAVRDGLGDGDVLLVGHAHQLRVLTARWLRQSAEAGQLYRLDTATLSVLGHEHGAPALLRWNLPGERDA